LMGTRGYRRFDWSRVLEGDTGRAPAPRASDDAADERVERPPGDQPEHPKGDREGNARKAEAEASDARPAEEPGGGDVKEQANRQFRGVIQEQGEQIPQGTGADRLISLRRNSYRKGREFPVPDYSGERDGPRDDFRDTLFWEPDLSTGEDGEATVSLHLSDAVTSFRVFTEGIGGGMPGRDETVVESSLPFSIRAKLPLEVSEGDEPVVPVTLSNEREEARNVVLNADFGRHLARTGGAEAGTRIEVPGGERVTRYFELEVTGTSGTSKVRLAATADGLSDAVEREISVAPRGFPRRISHSGRLEEEEVSHTVDLSAARAGTVEAKVEVYPGPVASMTDGLTGLVREPTGCFEQASSSNYPNVMLLRYLRESSAAAPGVVSEAKSKLDKGYRKLVGYETDERGFEWFGESPPHESLTAYGLLQFTQMRDVWDAVDQELIDRTAEWLLSRRDGDGGYERSDEALDNFGRASQAVANAYITYSLTEAGRGEELETEVEAQVEHVREAKDAYVLALATNTMINAGRGELASSGIDRLLEMQNDEGAWVEADHSITKSRGTNLHVETTALATIALLEHGGERSAVRRAVEWLSGQRSGSGTWGATQATILTLEALTRYSRKRTAESGPGSVRVLVDGEVVAERAYGADRADPVHVDLTGALDRGEQQIRLMRTEGEGSVPYTVSARYRTDEPATHPKAPVELEKTLADDELEMGDTVRLTATVENRTDEGLGMTMARIGLPGGLTTQKWQLKELQEDGPIAFYETRSREVILYFRQMKPGATETVPLELKTTVPGSYTAQASRSYPYYTDDRKYWVDPLEVEVSR